MSYPKNEVRHQCCVYDGSPSLQLDAFATAIELKLSQGYRCLYLNSLPMVMGMRSCLAGRGIDVAMEVAKARLVLSSEPVTSSDGNFDVDLMIKQLEEALNQALNDGYKGLWASGDMTWEFGPAKNFSKLLEYETQLEKLFWKRPELCGICQYHKDTLPEDALQQALLTHQGIFINETLSRINPHYTLMGEAHASSAAELDEAISNLCQATNKIT